MTDKDDYQMERLFLRVFPFPSSYKLPRHA